MRYVVCTLVGLVSLVALAEPAHAQLCKGMGSYRERPFQVEPGAWFGSGFRQIGAFVSGGGDRLYTGGTIAYVSFTEVDGSAMFLEGAVGADIPVDASGRVFVCPEGRVQYQRDSLDHLDVTPHGLGGMVLGRVGVIVLETPTVMIVPSANLGVRTTRFSAEGFESETDTYADLSLSTGFIFSRRYAIRPEVAIPLGSDPDRDPAFAVHVGINFGG